MKPIFTPQPGDAYTQSETNDRLVYISEELGWVYSSGTGLFVVVDPQTAVSFLSDPDWYLDVRNAKELWIGVCMDNFEVRMSDNAVD